MSRARIGVVIHRNRWAGVLAEADARRLETLGDVVFTDKAEPLTDDEAIELLADCDVALGSWNTPKPNRAILDACPKLRLWVHAAGSVKGHFGPHMEGRDLTVASCKTAIAENVAEMAVAQIVLGLRRVPRNAAANAAGRAARPDNVLVMADATVGVIGASDVGRETIRLLRANHAGAVLLYDPYVDAGEAEALGAEKIDDLPELCRRSHAVTLHTPAIPACEKMLAAEHFAAMRDDAVFVNTARGMCIDEEALIAELSKGRLLAFLDVSSPEPAADDSPLRRLENCVYTSHIAGGPGTNIGRQAVDDIAAFLRGEQPTCVVTADMLERLA